jgi:uncharacterized protein YbcV (DUF1398 family)
MNNDLLTSTTEGSFNGTMNFPQVVALLMAENVESYVVDLRQNLKTFYMPYGESLAEKFEFEGEIPAMEFSADKVIAAIRASQQGQVSYREFLVRVLDAGVTHYAVFLTGRKAVYYGRKGEAHVENFPQPK